MPEKKAHRKQLTEHHLRSALLRIEADLYDLVVRTPSALQPARKLIEQAHALLTQARACEPKK